MSKNDLSRMPDDEISRLASESCVQAANLPQHLKFALQHGKPADKRGALYQLKSRDPRSS